MAELVGGRTWRIQGREVTLPVTITNAEMAGAAFVTDSTAAAAVLREALPTAPGTPPLHPLAVAGRCLSMIMVVTYRDWVLDDYDEVGVGLFVRGPGGRPGLFLVDLPVTGAFTREAGEDFWGLPKWLMSADLTFGPRSASVTVRDGETFVARAELSAGRVAVPFRFPAPVLSWAMVGQGAQAGVLLKGSQPLRFEGVHVGRGTARVELGDHPMARRMARLGLTGRPLFTVHARRMTGPLDASVPVGSVAAHPASPAN